MNYIQIECRRTFLFSRRKKQTNPTKCPDGDMRLQYIHPHFHLLVQQRLQLCVYSMLCVGAYRWMAGWHANSAGLHVHQRLRDRVGAVGFEAIVGTEFSQESECHGVHRLLQGLVLLTDLHRVVVGLMDTGHTVWRLFTATCSTNQHVLEHRQTVCPHQCEAI